MLSRKCFLLVLALVVLAIAPAWARYDELTGPLGTVELTSSATWDGSAYVYSYEMYNRASNVGNIHGFVIANDNGSPFTDAANNSGFFNPAFNPALPDAVLEWMNGQIDLGASGTFSYRSICAPDPVPVAALVVNGGTGASGWTLGMGAPIPEPGCLASLAGGLLALTGIRYRKVRRNS